MEIKEDILGIDYIFQMCQTKGAFVTTLTLVYNVVGPRISDVGTRVGEFVLPDIEEQPFHALDLIGSWEFNQHFKFKLKLKNILFQKRQFRRLAVEVNTIRLAIPLSNVVVNVL